MALAEIQELGPRLGPGATGRLQALRALMGRRDSLEAALVSDAGDGESYLDALPAFDELRDSMTATLRALDEDIQQLRYARVAEQARLADIQRTISIALGALALLAAILVGWSAWRERRLRSRLEGALAEANRQRDRAERQGVELERAMEARVRLLRGVTHDVKNPLGAARGYAELLKMEVKGPLEPEQRPYVEGIQRSVDSALAIIADLLDLARADSGGLVVERVPTDVHAVAAAAVEDHRAAAEAAGHEIETAPPAERVDAFTDPARITQVLGNLLSNAIKYTPPGGRITIRTGRQAGLNGRPGAVIRVDDSGPGIPTERREAVFDEFSRLTDDGPQQGHGLGLAIARRITRLLGGDLTVEDSPVGGASFVLWLPLRNENVGAAEPPA